MVRTSVLGVQIGEEQVGVPGPEAAVAADVEVPAVLGGDDAEVLAPGLGALAGAAGHRRLDLVRCPQSAVAQLECDGEPDRVLHPVAAPGRADAGLHGAQRLAVRVARLEAGVDQPAPDVGQLLDPRAEQVDPLPAGDLRVETEVAGHLADHDQLVRGDLAAGYPRHHRVGAVALDVGQEVVVGVLQRGLLAVEDVPVAERGQDRGHHGLADVAAASGAVSGDQGRERADPRTRIRSNSSCREYAKCSQSAVDCATPASASSDLSSGTQEPQVVPARVHALTAGTSCAPVADRRPAPASLVTRCSCTPARRRAAPRPGRRRTGSRPACRAPARRPRPAADAYADASPTRMPPSSVRASSVSASLAYRPWAGSAYTTSSGPVGRAEAGHVDAEQLELGRRVGAAERRVAAEQPVDDDVGHRVAGGDQAVAAAVDGGALTDREDRRVARSGRPRRPGPRRARRPRSPAARASSSRGRTPAAKTTTSVSRARSPDVSTRSPSAPAARSPVTPVPQCTAMPELLDPAPQHRAAGLVELHRHEMRRELHDRGPQAQQPQGVRRLQTEQTAADDGPGGPPGRVRPAAPPGRRGSGRRSSRGLSVPGTGGTNGPRPGRQHQRVVRVLPRRRAHHPRASRSIAVAGSPSRRSTPAGTPAGARVSSSARRRPRSRPTAAPGRRRAGSPRPAP